MVSASKMRRAQEAAYKSRDFSNVASEILTRLRQLTDVNEHPLFKQHKIQTRLHLVIASDRTLAGAYNSNVLRTFAKELQQDKAEGIISQAIVIGRQVARYVSKIKDIEVVAVYQNFPEHPTANDIRPLLNSVVEMFTSGQADAIDVIFTDYKSSIRQEVMSHRLLPAAFQEIEIDSDLEQAIFEPSVRAVLDNVSLRLIEAQLSQDILESFASEHSMRMIAMKNASDNATDIIGDLTLALNTARQASITQEIAEITGGAEAIT